MKITSSSEAARAAVAGFVDIRVDNTGQQVSLGSSNIASMKEGAEIADQVLHRISELLSSLKKQAQGVPALAAAIEERDRQDSMSLREPR